MCACRLASQPYSGLHQKKCGHEADQRVVLRRQAGRVVQSREEKALGRPRCSLPVPKGGLPGSGGGTLSQGV